MNKQGLVQGTCSADEGQGHAGQAVNCLLVDCLCIGHGSKATLQALGGQQAQPYVAVPCCWSTCEITDACTNS